MCYLFPTAHLRLWSGAVRRILRARPYRRLPPPQRDDRTDRLQQSERPRALEDPVGRSAHTARGERQGEPPAALLEGVAHQHRRYGEQPKQREPIHTLPLASGALRRDLVILVGSLLTTLPCRQFYGWGETIRRAAGGRGDAFLGDLSGEQRGVRAGPPGRHLSGSGARARSVRALLQHPGA